MTEFTDKLDSLNIRYDVIGDCLLINGDSLHVLPLLPPESIDSVVCDPPYGLEFMGKSWDGPNGWQTGAGFSKPGIGERKTDWPSFTGANDEFGGANPTCEKCGGRARGKKKCGCEEPDWRVKGKRPDPMYGRLRMMGNLQKFCEAWASKCLPLLKPGSHLLSFGGSRTYHRMCCGVEDAGFEVRDQIMWLYGSGFPKSHDVSKAIDSHLGSPRNVQGRGDPVDRNALDYGGGTGKAKNGLKSEYTLDENPRTEESAEWEGWGTALKPAHEPIVMARKPLSGTVAANVLQHGTGAINVDGCRVPLEGDYKCGANGRPSQTGLGDNYDSEAANQHDDQGRWPANVTHDGSDEVVELFPEQQSGGTPQRRFADKTRNTFGDFQGNLCPSGIQSTSGNAARFFYSAKASKADRTENGQVNNSHPTVKPTELMQWLCRLVTPPCGLIIDPFMGSGSTGKAAVREGFAFIGIESEEDYFETACERIRIAVREKSEELPFGDKLTITLW